jgi:hypothetical protein
MSADDLAWLADQHAFDPYPRREDLAVYHLPFDDLTGGRGTEGRLRTAAHRGERVTVMGLSGVGKSSVIAYTLGPLEPGIVPFRVPVADEPPETVTSSLAFAQHMIRTVSLEAERGAMISPGEREQFLRDASDRHLLSRRERTTRRGWATKVGPELVNEIRSVTEPAELARSGSEVLDQAARLMELVQAAGLFPVVIIDDADAWLRLPGSDRRDLAEAFFGQVLRSLAELPCGLVVAAHDQYKQLAGYQAAAGMLEFTIDVPVVPDPRALTRLLGHRAAQHLDTPGIEIIDLLAADLLFDYYQGPAHTSLRRTLVVFQGALEHAYENGDSVITARSIEAAHAQL